MTGDFCDLNFFHFGTDTFGVDDNNDELHFGAANTAEKNSIKRAVSNKTVDIEAGTSRV